jgi:chromosome segregation ATPase
MTNLSSNRDLDIEAKADIPFSHRIIKGVNAPESTAEIVELHTSIQKYKQYIDKLNEQLTRYQTLIPLVGIEESKMVEGKEIPEEAQDFILLLADHPLIQSYEHHFQALEKENGSLKRDLEQLKVQHNNMSKESEVMAKSLMEKTKKLAEVMDPKKGFIEGSIEGIAELKDNYKKEQAALLNEIELSHQRIATLENELKVQTQVSIELADKNKELNERLFKLQNFSETLAADREKCDRKLNTVNDDLRRCTDEKEDFYTQKTRLETDFKLMQKSAEQYKEAYEELEMRKSRENEALEKELNDKELTIKDQKTKLFLQEREIDDLKDINRKLQRDLDQTKNDFTQMLKIMEDHESRIALFDEREKELKILESNCRKKISETELLEEQLKIKERQYQDKIQTIEKQWKRELDEKQKKCDALLDLTRGTNRTLLDKHEEEINTLNENNYRLKSSLDKAIAEHKIAEEERNKTVNALTEFQKSLQDKNINLESKLRDTVRKELEEKQTLQVRLSEISHSLGRFEEKAKEAEDKVKSMKLELETAEKKASVLEQENKELRSTCGTLTDEKKSFTRELDRVRRLNQSKVNEVEDVYNIKLKTQTSEMERMKERYKTGEAKLYHLLKQQEGIAEKWRTEHQQSVRYFEKVVGELNSQMKSLRKENVSLKASIKENELGSIIVREKSLNL